MKSKIDPLEVAVIMMVRFMVGALVSMIFALIVLAIISAPFKVLIGVVLAVPVTIIGHYVLEYINKVEEWPTLKNYL